MNCNLKLFLTMSVVFLYACVTPYYPDITKYENILVVDGELTNLKGPYRVRLSISSSFSEFPKPVSGAVIKIIDNRGLEQALNEDAKGEYYTIDTTFRGVIGTSYKLHIEYDGEVYESDLEKIKQLALIDKVYWEYKPLDAYGPSSVGIYLDSHDSLNQSRYYGWTFDETWKYKVPIDIIPQPDWKICYRSDSTRYFKLGTTIQRNSDIVNHQSIINIGEQTNKLYYRYSVLVRQYSFSEQLYNYLFKLGTINLSQGSLFDPTPYSLSGNIRNTKNNDKPVLGYFVVAGVSEKRIFIDRSELPKSYNPTDGFDDCTTEFTTVSPDLTDFRQDSIVNLLMNKGYQIYNQYEIINSITNEHKIELSLSRPVCFNCTLQGTNVVPKFWIEK